MKRLLILSSLVLLSACNSDKPLHVQDSFEIEGCVVKSVYNPRGYDFFIAHCRADSEIITGRRTNGKSSAPIPTIMTSDALRAQLADVEAKEKALSKLSPEDKQALGIK